MPDQTPRNAPSMGVADEWQDLSDRCAAEAARAFAYAADMQARADRAAREARLARGEELSLGGV